MRARARARVCVRVRVRACVRVAGPVFAQACARVASPLSWPFRCNAPRLLFLAFVCRRGRSARLAAVQQPALCPSAFTLPSFQGTLGRLDVSCCVRARTTNDAARPRAWRVLTRPAGAGRVAVLWSPRRCDGRASVQAIAAVGLVVAGRFVVWGGCCRRCVREATVPLPALREGFFSLARARPIVCSA